MTWESWAWIIWAAAALVVEGLGLTQKDRPGKPRTLSANTWWLILSAGPWHRRARVGLLLFLCWLFVHLFTHGWV